MFFFDIELGVPARIVTPSLSALPLRDMDYSHMKILVAEDHSLNQDLLRSLLAKMNCHQVDIANNGKEAVDLYRASEYQLVLMDCQMPEMDGFEATRQIRLLEQKRGEHVPIVALTADIIKADREKCLDAGMDGHMNKPITLAKLQNLLETVLDNPAPDRQHPLQMARN